MLSQTSTRDRAGLTLRAHLRPVHHSPLPSPLIAGLYSAIRLTTREPCSILPRLAFGTALVELFAHDEKLLKHKNSKLMAHAAPFVLMFHTTKATS